MTKFRLSPAELMQRIKTSKGFDRVLSKVKVMSLENGSGHAEFTVEQEHTNLQGELHPAFIMTVGDNLSAYGFSTHEHGNSSHVSINIQLSLYPPPAKLGDQIEVVTKTLRGGHSVAFLEFMFKNKSTGQLLAKGYHNMFILHPNLSKDQNEKVLAEHKEDLRNV